MSRLFTVIAALLSAPRAPLALMLSGVGLWLLTFGRGLWLNSLYGPICGVTGHGLTAPHCASCYVAASLMVSGVVLASLTVPKRRYDDIASGHAG